jgi:hypothetical protein
MMEIPTIENNPIESFKKRSLNLQVFKDKDDIRIWCERDGKTYEKTLTNEMCEKYIGKYDIDSIDMMEKIIQNKNRVITAIGLYCFERHSDLITVFFLKENNKQESFSSLELNIKKK